MNPGDFSVLILAAGKGTRMNSDLAKVLHPVAGAPMLQHVLDTSQKLKPARTVVVIGHQGDRVKDWFQKLNKVQWVRQKEMKGTGDAVAAAAPAFQGVKGNILVLYGDIPSIKIETLRRLFMFHRSSKNSITLLTAELEEPTGYGRIVLAPDGTVERIVEEKDASLSEKEIQEVNTGISIYDSQFLFQSVQKLTPANKQNELYLTDLVKIAHEAKRPVGRMRIKDPTEVLGINDRESQADVSRYIYENHLAELMKNGVSFEDPATTIVDPTVKMENDIWIESNTGVRGESAVMAQVHILAGTQVYNSQIGTQTQVGANCVIQNARIGESCKVGSNTVLGISNSNQNDSES